MPYVLLSFCTYCHGYCPLTSSPHMYMYIALRFGGKGQVTWSEPTKPKYRGWIFKPVYLICISISSLLLVFHVFHFFADNTSTLPVSQNFTDIGDFHYHTKEKTLALCIGCNGKMNWKRIYFNSITCQNTW